MIIERLDLKAFGRFTDESLDLSAGPRRFHVVYGPNESGKSTCLRAISSLLFGFPTRTEDNYVHSNAKLRIGATLIDRTGNRTTVVRRKNGKTKLHAADDKTPVDPATIDQMLGGIDEAAFHHRFGLSHEQLVIGGKAVLDSKGELGELLFAAGAGVGQLKSIQSQLENESKDLFLERGKKKINALLSDLDEKRKALRELQTPPAHYRSLKEQLASAEQTSKGIAVDRARVSQTLGKRKAYREARPIVPIWRHEKERLSALDSVPNLDEDFVARRREASANKLTYEKLVDQLRREIAETEKRITERPIDSATIQHESEIVSLFQGIAAREAASKDQENLVRIAKNRNRHLREFLRDLEIEVPDSADQSDIDRIVNGLHVSDASQIRITELAGDCEMLRQQERDSLESLQSLRKQLAELEDELERHPATGDPAVIDAVIAEIGSPVALLDQVDQERSAVLDLESECRLIIQELRLGDMSLSDATKLQLPSAGMIDEHEQALEARRRSVEEASKSLLQLKQRCQETRDALARLQSDQPLPTESELSQSRSHRDQLVDRLVTVREDENQFRICTGAVRESIQSADRVVDTIRLHQKQVTQRASLAAEMERLEADTEVARQRVVDAQARAREAEQQWTMLWESRLIPPGSVREMRNWIVKHQTLIEKSRTLAKERGRLESTQTRIHRNASRLAAVMRNTWSSRPVAVANDDLFTELDGDDSTDPMNLESLHDGAIALRNELVKTATQIDRLSRKRDEIQSAIPVAEAKYESNVAKRKQWDEDWKRAVTSFSGDQECSPSVISTRLKKIGKLFEETRERDILLGRIRSIDDDNRSFAERVGVVRKMVAADINGEASSFEVAQLLYERLQTAKLAAKQVEGLRVDLADAKARLVRDLQTLEMANAQLDELCREAGVENVEELPSVEQKSSEKRAAVRSYEHAAQKLALIAAGESLDQFVAEVESYDPVDLDAEIVSLEESVETLNERWSTVEQEVGGLKKQLFQIDGGDRAAELNQELQLLTGSIQREAQRYAKLRIASMILQRSIEHYRAENESPVLKLACDAFEELTCGRYVGLKPEFDDKGRSMLFGVEKSSGGDDVLVPVDAMSLGTADALFLAMRLASLEHQLSAGHAIPVVIDDCLIQLDDDRAVAAMKRFSSLSERTQVILFTHHRHLIELAESTMNSDQYHVHRLSV